LFLGKRLAANVHVGHNLNDSLPNRVPPQKVEALRLDAPGTAPEPAESASAAKEPTLTTSPKVWVRQLIL
jgi:hypothetical protein